MIRFFPAWRSLLQKSGHAFNKVRLGRHPFQLHRGILNGGADIAMQVRVYLPFRRAQ